MFPRMKNAVPIMHSLKTLPTNVLLFNQKRSARVIPDHAKMLEAYLNSMKLGHYVDEYDKLASIMTSGAPWFKREPDYQIIYPNERHKQYHLAIKNFYTNKNIKRNQQRGQPTPLENYIIGSLNCRPNLTKTICEWFGPSAFEDHYSLVEASAAYFQNKLDDCINYIQHLPPQKQYGYKIFMYKSLSVTKIPTYHFEVVYKRNNTNYVLFAKSFFGATTIQLQQRTLTSKFAPPKRYASRSETQAVFNEMCLHVKNVGLLGEINDDYFQARAANEESWWEKFTAKFCSFFQPAHRYARYKMHNEQIVKIIKDSDLNFY